MERLLIRVPLLLVEWLNPVGSGATFLLYHKKCTYSWQKFTPIQAANGFPYFVLTTAQPVAM